MSNNYNILNRSRFGFCDVLIYTISGLLVLSMIYPFLYLLAVSFSTKEEIYRTASSLFITPRGFTLDGYIRFLKIDLFLTGYVNTVVRTIAGTLSGVFIMAVTAYPLAKKYLPYRNFYTGFVTFTMLFSGGLIPGYLLIRGLGLLDNRLALILPVLINTFLMFIIRNFFMDIPVSIEESAKIDGANDIIIFLRLIIPLSVPVLVTVGLWTAIGHWNAWFDSLIYIQTPSKQVVSVQIRKLIIERSNELFNKLSVASGKDNAATPESMQAAAIMMTVLPILCVYPLIQRYYVQGIMIGSIKG